MALFVKGLDGILGSVVAGSSTLHETTAQAGRLLATERSAVLTTWAVVVAAGFVVVWKFTDFDFSVVQMLSSACMLWAFALLRIKVNSQNSAKGVSSKMLEMWLVTLFIRLSSTLIKNGYLPEDKSGDHLYQFFDVCCIVMLMQLTYSLQRQHQQTYQEEDDLPGIFWTVPSCIMLAVTIHPNLNRSFMFDTLWTTAQYLETFCMFPQLYMITKQGGRVESFSAQFLVLMFLSRVFAWLFWYTGYHELADGYVEGVSAGEFNWPGYLVMALSTVQVLASLDFMYYYVRAALSGRHVVLPAVEV